MSRELVYYTLWITPAAGFVWLSAMMLRRKLQKELPLFFAFVVFQVVTFAVDFYAYNRSPSLYYFYAYWTTAGLGIAISFGVLYEVFTGVFRPFVGLREFGTIVFRWAALILALAAILLAASSRPVPGSTQLFTVIMNSMRSVELMQCGLVLLMLLCSSYLGITLRHRIFGIALGFGIIAAVDLIVVAVLSNFGLQAKTFVQVSKMLAYNLSALLWMGYVYAGEVERRPEKQLIYAERWNFALAAAMHPGNDAASLPRIEDTVERVWKQANGHSKKPKGPAHGADQ
ncbi:MAG: hypothetical protein LAN70_03345 [Acidobacteriia bacterium]|nr:hypothetical protein [Terriglobia bacterium]